MYPELVGVLIDRDMDKLLSAGIISRNGGEAILPNMTDQSPHDGDKLIMTMVIVGVDTDLYKERSKKKKGQICPFFKYQGS